MIEPGEGYRKFWLLLVRVWKGLWRRPQCTNCGGSGRRPTYYDPEFCDCETGETIPCVACGGTGFKRPIGIW